MKLVFFLILSAVGFVLNKGQVLDSYVETLDINLKQKNEIITDSLVESLTLIPLETNVNCLITNIAKIKKYGDKIYVLDRKMGEVLIFNLDGKFLEKVSRKGRGYGEYVMISDFDVHPKNGNIYINDGMTGKIMVFKGNRFIKDFKPPFVSHAHGFCFLDENNMVFDNHFSNARKDWWYQLFFTDSKMKIVDKKIPYEKCASLSMSPISPFSKVGDKFSYQPAYKDTIFHIENLKLLPKYKLDFGDHWLDRKYLLDEDRKSMTFIRDIRERNEIYFLNTIESKAHLFVYFSHKGKQYAYLYDKTTKKVFFLKDYMNNSCGYHGLPIISDSDLFIGVVNSFELLKANKNILQKHSLLKNLKEGDNPILSFIKFKEIN